MIPGVCNTPKPNLTRVSKSTRNRMGILRKKRRRSRSGSEGWGIWDSDYFGNNRMRPTVSVITPAYNQARYLNQAIDSVFQQTFSDYEIIVVNDGSTDETAQVLAGYGDRIRVITQANAGLSAARNSGLRAAQGEMIAFLDADDLWYPEMLSTTVAHLRANPETDFVSGAWDYINEAGKTIRRVNKPSAEIKPNEHGDFFRTLALGNLFHVAALLFRRNCFDCCGFFDPSLRSLEDWDLWLRLAAHGHKIGLVDTPVSRYRRHSGSMTLDAERTVNAFHQVLTKLLCDEAMKGRVMDLRDHMYVLQWLYTAIYCKEAGLDAEALRYVRMAEGYAPEFMNEALAGRYLWVAFELPEADACIQRLLAPMPERLASYRRTMVHISVQHGKYRDAFLRAGQLIIRHPAWLIRKALARLDAAWRRCPDDAPKRPRHRDQESQWQENA